MEFNYKLNKRYPHLNKNKKSKNLLDKMLNIFYIVGLLSISYIGYENYKLKDKEKQYQYRLQINQNILQECENDLKEKSIYLTNNSKILLGIYKDNYITISSKDYINYKNQLPLKIKFKNNKFILSKNVTNSELEIFDKLLKILKLPTKNKEKDAQSILDFVHTYDYIPNSYTKMPLETLVDSNGDCDDFSLLAYSFMKQLDIDAVLIIYSPLNDPHIKPYHMMVGVSGNFNGDYTIYKNKKYYLAETTGTDLEHISQWKIGELPKNLKQNYKVLGFIQ